MWLYDTSCIGYTFSDTFSSKAKPKSLNALGNSIGHETTLKRKPGNKTFALFSSLLRFSTMAKTSARSVIQIALAIWRQLFLMEGKTEFWVRFQSCRNDP